jgi:two-component system, NarL family, sensor histidine kinase DesK
MRVAGAEGAVRAPDPVLGAAGRFSVLVATVWLLFLVDPLVGNWDERSAGLTWLGYLSTIAFAATYTAIFVLLHRRRVRFEMTLPLSCSVALLSLLLLCWLGMMAGFGQEGSGAVIFVTVSAAILLPTRYAAGFVLLTAGVAAALSVLQTGWRRDLEFPLLAIVAGFVMWAVGQVMTRNAELMRTREENELLLVEGERNRFARDLHDILGHSLTVIAVKAELARRLLEVDDRRAGDELADLERLSRDALADVRRAVQGYRDITLPGELARARGVLDAAGIRAVVPSSTDDVSGELREVFAWTIREAVTNIVRHSSARNADIELSSTRLRITNDGVSDGVDGHHGGPLEPHVDGSGLVGLRERVEALGGDLTVRHDGARFVIEVTGP